MAQYNAPVETKPYHYENFPVGSWLVPAVHRPVIHEIYRFARYADDIADEGNKSSAERIAALENLLSMLTGASKSGVASSSDQVAEKITSDLLQRFDQKLHAPIKQAIFKQLGLLVDAFIQDARNTPDIGLSPAIMFSNQAELMLYCSRSANPVGRMMLILFDRYNGHSETDLTLHSDAICSGLQWLNFMQDVASDAQRKRIYVPRDELKTRRSLSGIQDVSPAVILNQTHRARALLASGYPLLKSVPLRLSLELRAIMAGGLSLADKIIAARGDTISIRPKLSSRDLPLLITRFVMPS